MGTESRYIPYSYGPRERPPWIVNRTAEAYEGRRICERSMAPVDALVLHQTGFSRGDSVTAYDRVTAHFVVSPLGTTIQLHPLWYYLHSSNGLNTRGVAVEFVGNFPNADGRWWSPAAHGSHKPSREQIQAGQT